MRSRLQQSGFHIKDVEVNENNKLQVRLSNLTGKDIVNVPESFGLLRLFIDLPEKRLTGKELFKTMGKIFGEESSDVTKKLEGKDWNPQLLWHSNNVGVIQSPKIDLNGIINASGRDELHKALQIKWGDIDTLQPKGFYLAKVTDLQVPNSICLRIVTDPNKIFLNESQKSLSHLNSPIVDPGFNGDLIFEHTRSYTEEDSDRANPVSVFAYKINTN
jgi:hypothetical protein